jgi:hypothetical protein
MNVNYWPVELDITQSDLIYIPDILTKIFAVPFQRTDKIYEKEIHYSIDDIRKAIKSEDLHDHTVATFKEKKIIEAINELALEVSNDFKNLMGDDKYYDYHQNIEVPWAMIDMCPGDTQIHVKIYTRRELIKHGKEV